MQCIESLRLGLVLTADNVLYAFVIYSPFIRKEDTANYAYLKSLTIQLSLLVLVCS
jgi:hypothetical protein